MTGPAVRSRLHALRLERQAARLGRELLDHKREAILRALLDHTRRRERARAALDAQYARATSALRDARIMVGGGGGAPPPPRRRTGAAQRCHR
jgi:vacuolar-type H+-ATPase subunit D/Vma8